jgi:hypothetical protein
MNYNTDGREITVHIAFRSTGGASCDVLLSDQMGQHIAQTEVDHTSTDAFILLNNSEAELSQVLVGDDQELAAQAVIAELERQRVELEVLNNLGGIRSEDYILRANSLDEELYSLGGSEDATASLGCSWAKDDDTDTQCEAEIDQYLTDDDLSSMTATQQQRTPLAKARQEIVKWRGVMSK